MYVLSSIAALASMHGLIRSVLTRGTNKIALARLGSIILLLEYYAYNNMPCILLRT